jgi:ribosomal protein L7/L12
MVKEPGLGLKEAKDVVDSAPSKKKVFQKRLKVLKNLKMLEL